MAHALMVLGTASNVGKSWLATGICALARRRGIGVAPFKVQNLSNNAAPARDLDGGWGEIGRAQALQARACGLPPHVDMNPLLLKPEGAGCQTVLEGHALSPDRARALWADRDALWQRVTAAYGRLADSHELVVLEGAGSPVELNLVDRDLVNGRMALHAAAVARDSGHDGACLLVGDISRGGLFAALAGTVALMPPDLRALTRGLVVNRFQGAPRHFEPGPALLAQATGVPVRGVIPWRPDIPVDPEDDQDTRDGSTGLLDLAVLRLPTVSNFEDLVALGHLDPVRLRFVDDPADLGWPDLLVLPGSKDSLADLAWLERTGLDRAVQAAAAAGTPVLGLCGGYQLLGERLDDQPGLGLLPVQTRFASDKQVRPAAGRTAAGWLLPAGLPVSGYEIHSGRSTSSSPALLQLGHADGAVQGPVAGTYLHGFLDSGPVRRALVDGLLDRRGLPPWQGPLAGAAHQQDAALDQLADLVEAHLDLDGLLP